MARSDSSSFDPRLLLVGLVAGIAFGMIEMPIEAVIGRGFWAPARFIASVVTPGADTDPSFSLVPVVVGLLGHLMNAMNFGLLFVFVISRVTNRPRRLAVIGVAYGAAVFILMWFVILPAIDPAVRLLNAFGFFVSHLLYGLILGVGVAWVRSGAQAEGRPPA